MEDYPRDVVEFEARFATEEACRDYLFRLRWPDGFRCPRCGHARLAGAQGVVAVRPLRAAELSDRRHDLPGHPQAAAAVVPGDLAGHMAKERRERIGRRAMVRPGRERLSGVVELDETYWGGPQEGLSGGQTERKALIAVAVEEKGVGMGRIRMRRVGDASAASLVPFVEDLVEPGSSVHTDDWLGYEPLAKKGYRHRIVFLSGRRKQASELLPRVHKTISLLKRWMLGTHQGAISHEHLDYYLDELVFRFNRRNSRSRGKLFYRLVQQAVAVEPLPYRSIIADGEDETL